MIFFIKKWPNFGCHLWGSIKHPWFFAIFLFFFLAPILGGDRVFALCCGPGSLRNTGGSAFFFWGGVNTGKNRVPCANLLPNAGGKRASNMLCPVFLLIWGFWAVSGGSRACTEEEAEEEEKEEAEEAEDEEERRRRRSRRTKRKNKKKKKKT